MKFASMEEQAEAQQKIREASTNEEFTRPMAQVTHEAQAHNRSCGDEIKVQIEVSVAGSAPSIANLSGQVHGCLVTKAAWHLLAQELRGMSISSAATYLKYYQTTLHHSRPPHIDGAAHSPSKIVYAIPLPLLAFCRPSPRKDCALLPAQALMMLFDSHFLNI